MDFYGPQYQRIIPDPSPMAHWRFQTWRIIPDPSPMAHDAYGSMAFHGFLWPHGFSMALWISMDPLIALALWISMDCLFSWIFHGSMRVPMDFYGHMAHHPRSKPHGPFLQSPEWRSPSNVLMWVCAWDYGLLRADYRAQVVSISC